jgi:hypothetical protein
MKVVVSKTIVFSILILGLGRRLHAQNGIEQNARGLKQELSNKQRQRLTCDIEWMISESETGRNFSVRLSYKESQLAGQRIVLTRKDCDSGKTDDPFVVEDQADSQGVVRFFDIPPGQYEVSVDGLLGPSAEIRVTAKSLKRAEIKMEWPAEVISVRDIRGNFGVWGKDDLLPLASASLEVIELRNAVPVASGITGAFGEYSFAGLPQGIYLLRAKFPAEGKMEAATYEMAVDVNSSADDEEMNWTILSRTQCGIGRQLSSNESDKELFESALSGFKREDFEYGRLALAVLNNTYPDSVYTSKIGRFFQSRKHDLGDIPPSDVCSNDPK